MANRLSAFGRKRKVAFTSTAWKCCQYVWDLSDHKVHHVLVRSDSMTVVSYINCQGILAECLLKWAQLNLSSLRATHVPRADMLSRSNAPSYEWTLHPQMVQEIWEIFSRPEVNVFTSEDNSLPSTGPTSFFTLSSRSP